jgi:hypothetical protein
MNRRKGTTTTTVASAALLAVGVALALSACGSTGEGPAADADPSASAPTFIARSSGGPIRAKQRARDQTDVGRAIVLHGVDDELALRVRLLDFVDPAVPKEGWLRPERYRYAAVKLAVANVGSVAFRGTLWDGALLVGADGTASMAQESSLFVPGVASLALKQGERRVGYLTFGLGKREQVTTLLITLLGRAEAGEWRLRANGREAQR